MTTLHLPPGRIVAGRFTIQAELGRRGTCVTYRAITAPNREVAIRLFDPSFPNARGAADALFHAHRPLQGDLERFIAPIVEVGMDDETGATFLVSPLLATPSLAQLVALCPFEPRDAAAMIVSLGRALDALHARGMAHLALKPTNVFVGPAPGWSVRLSDLSTPLLAGREATGDSARWLAPELAGEVGSPGPPADVFSMALVAFYALTGASLLPDAPEDAETWRVGLALGPSASKRAGELGVTLPDGVDAVFRRALAVPPAQRPHGAGAFANELAVVLDPERPAAPDPTRSALGSADELFGVVEPAPASNPGQPLQLGPPASDPAGAAPLLLAAPAFQSSAADVDPPVIPMARPPRTLILAAVGAVFFLLLTSGIVMITLALRAQSKRRAAFEAATTPIESAMPTPTVSLATREVAPPPPPSPPPAASPQPSEPTPPPVATEAPPAPTATEAAERAPLQLAAKHGELTVSCTPVPCELVMLDGKQMSEYPEPVAVRAGNHGIGISRRGYGGQWQLVPIAEGERKTVSFTLQPQAATPAPAAPPKKCGKFLQRCD